MDRKGIFSFLAITFVLTWGIEIPPIAGGLNFVGGMGAAGAYVILPFMLIPAIAALITVKFITREGLGGLGLRFGPWKQYLVIGLLIPALFALIYAVTWALGLGQPDWGLTYFTGLFAQAGQPAPEMPDTRLVLLALFFVTLTVGTLFNGVFLLGEELGWRGYLLPKLMPLGKTRAYLLLGLIWSAWHWPLVWAGFVYGQQAAVLPFVFFTLLTTIFGVYLNELRMHTGSSILAGWAHGVFNTQKLGLWYLLFPAVAPYLPNPYLGGYAGLVGLIVWSGLAYWELRKRAEQRQVLSNSYRGV